MIRVQDQGDVHDPFHQLVRLLAPHHVEEVPRVRQRGIGLHRLLPLAKPCERGGHGGHLRDQLD